MPQDDRGERNIDMKKIVNGKMYNTETAECVAHYSFGRSSDFEYVYEGLFVKKTGEWFLHGCGGPMTDYRKCYGQNEWGGSERIIPYTEKEAKQWLCSHEFVDEYIKYFGEPEE